MIDLEDIEDIEPMEGDKPEIDLPFKEEKFEIGEWVYSHQVGVLASLILYLIVMILFVSTKITIKIQPTKNVIAVDLQPLAELERERDELRKSVEEMLNDEKIDWEEVENAISNESSTEEQVNIEEEIERMMEEAAEYQRQMEANRVAYERGMAEAQDLIDNPRPQEPFLESQKRKPRDAKVGGSVTVSYILDNPVRHSRQLIVPAYLCEGGGKVSIRIAVNQQGEVTSAKVISGGDECMQQSALNAAYASLFDINRGAPLRHMGLIIYTFVPQQR